MVRWEVGVERCGVECVRRRCAGAKIFKNRLKKSRENTDKSIPEILETTRSYKK